MSSSSASTTPMMMSSTTTTNSQQQTADLWLKIDQLHLNYLKAEESAAKINIRKKLEAYVHQVHTKGKLGFQ